MILLTGRLESVITPLQRRFFHLRAEMAARAGTEADQAPSGNPTYELEFLRKGNSRKVLCAALVKARASVKNDWLASRLRMGNPAAMSQLVGRTLKDPKRQKILKKYDKIVNSKD